MAYSLYRLKGLCEIPTSQPAMPISRGTPLNIMWGVWLRVVG